MLAPGKRAHEIDAIPGLVEAGPGIPPHSLPDPHRTFPAIDLKPSVKTQGGGKILPKGEGSWEFQPAATETSPLFEFTLEIPKSAKRGDIILVKVSADYPSFGRQAARTVEFLEFIHIR